MFTKGEYVVYGNAGICQVQDVTTMKMPGIPDDRLYYVLRPMGKADDTIYTPIEPTRTVLRRIMTRAEAEELISDIPNIEVLEIENDKMREAKYRECLKACDGRETIRILKTIHDRRVRRLQKGKKSTSLDDRYLKLAEASLYSELSKLLEIPKDQVRKLMEGHLTKTE